MNFFSTLSEIEVEEYQASAYPQSSFSVQDLSGYGKKKRGALNQTADQIAKIAVKLVRSGKAMDVDAAVKMAMEDYCKPGLSGLGDDQSILDAVVADARDVQVKHKQLVNNMAAWEEREPGRLTTDDDLRNAFDDSLAALKDQFTQRGLSLVGVTFPYQLDRTNPAHAIVLAVRDDIADTISMLEAKKWQSLIAKEVQDIRALPSILKGSPSLPSLDPLKDLGKYLLWGAGILGAAIVFSKFGGRS